MYRRKRKKSKRLLLTIFVFALLTVGVYVFVIANNGDGEQDLVGPASAGVIDNASTAYTLTDNESNTYAQISEEEEKLFFEALITALQNSVDAQGGRIGISFLCLTSSRQISIGGESRFLGASTSKLPAHMIIAEMIEEGQLSWDQTVRYEQEHFEGGTGILQHHIRVGNSFPIYELLRLSIVYSDNIAHRMLTSLFTSAHLERHHDIYRRYFPGEITEGTNHYSPNQMVRLLSILHEGKDEIEGYARIYQHMRETSFQHSLYTPYTRDHLAHTIGTNDPYFHDVGIFSTERPYILAVMTYRVEDAMNYIGSVSNLVWLFMSNFGKTALDTVIETMNDSAMMGFDDPLCESNMPTPYETDISASSSEETTQYVLALCSTDAMTAATFIQPTDISWYKQLFNQYNRIDSSFSPPAMRTLAGSHVSVDARIYEPLNQLMESARATGATIWAQSGYRPYSTQRQLFENRVSTYIGRGYSREQAEQNTALWIARPGTSEHQSGLAVDFNCITMAFEQTSAFRWLVDNAHRYGFILRYLPDTTHITGVNYEPWHFRYVGVYHASRIWEHGLTLEEYIKWYFGS